MKRVIIVMVTLMMFFIYSPSIKAADDISGHWSEQDMRTLISYKIMNGYEDNTYRPDKNITRAEFATLVVKALNYVPSDQANKTNNQATQLSDLNPNEWYYNDVIKAINEGIIIGYEDNTFRPSKSISRQEMAIMIMRAVNAREIYSELAPLNFKDNSEILKSYAKDEIRRIVYLKIMNGDTQNKFSPTKTSTRAEVATVLVRMIKIFQKEPIVTYSNYELTINDMINKQMTVKPQTDLYRIDRFVSGDSIGNIRVEKNKTYGDVINTTSLNIRDGASVTSNVIGRIGSSTTAPAKVEILGSVVNENQETWYKINYAWLDAKREDVAQYVNPSSFPLNSKEAFQFLLLSKRAGVSATELNNKILINKGILQGRGASFIEASIQHNINEIYLVSHALLETGSGGSNLARGIQVSLVKRDKEGKPLATPITLDKPVTVYNMYGIGAVDSCPEECGAERAYWEGWVNPEAAIVGGAKFISERYVNNKDYMQDTLYKMRWNPDFLSKNPNKNPEHQYASDIGWAVKQVDKIHQMYQLLDSYTLYYDVPVFKK